jgi:hypothetical protein
MGYWFAANMLGNALWLIIFQQATPPFFILGGVVIIGMLISCIAMLIIVS